MNQNKELYCKVIIPEIGITKEMIEDETGFSFQQFQESLSSAKQDEIVNNIAREELRKNNVFTTIEFL